MIHALVWLFDAGWILWSGMDGFPRDFVANVIATIEAANQRLYALREQARAKRQTAVRLTSCRIRRGNGLPWDAGSSAIRQHDRHDCYAAGPPGVVCQPLTAVLRRQARESSSDDMDDREWLARFGNGRASSADTANEQHKPLHLAMPRQMKRNCPIG